LVAQNGKLKLADLHRTLSVDKSTTTRLVNPLVKQGLILREKSNSDSRAINLRLTKKGVEVHRKVWECLAGFITSIQLGIPEEKRIDVYEALKIFLKALQNACTTGQYRANLETSPQLASGPASSP